MVRNIRLPVIEFSYDNNYHSSIYMAPFEALYGRKCRSPIGWHEIGETHITESELSRETTIKTLRIRSNLLATRYINLFKIIKQVGFVAHELE